MGLFFKITTIYNVLKLSKLAILKYIKTNKVNIN